MTIPDGAALLDPAWVERVVHGLAGWPFGPVRVVDMTRIGVEHGLSGQVHRVAASTADRDRVTFIIKQDSVAAAERGELGEAIGALRAGPASWIHTDAHLDNILWRPDGSAVLLDWAGAVIGPPAVDAARFLIEGPRGVAADERRCVALIEIYQRELVARGVQTSVASEMSIAVGQAMLPLAQSIIGWAGRPESVPPAPRMAALRENAVRNMASWLFR